jgi:tetratricopeptide (TPR) repeat protein
MTSRARRAAWIWLAATLGLVGAVALDRRLTRDEAGATPHAPPPTPHDDPVTFAGDVAPIVFAKCAACHRPGEAAPFSLLSYDDVRSHAKQIVEVTRTGFMPPWLPAPAPGSNAFANERRLTGAELDTLQRWSDAGAPRGDAASEPAPPAFEDGWRAGPPDLVLESPAYTLTDRGGDVFRNFVVPVDIESPRWVRSIELRPLNPRVTHHARLGIDSSNESVRRDAEDAEPGYEGMAWGQDPDGQLVIWAPGVLANPGVPDAAWPLHPRSHLVLHTHLQPSGKPEIVRFRIGIRFTPGGPGAPKVRAAVLRIGSCDIDIPAGASRHLVTDAFTVPVDVDVHTIFPHAHSLCRELSVIAEKPDGSREPLIVIDRFDENWHDVYRYRAPVRLPRGTKLVSTFAYDNTDTNLRNRSHPPRRVVYGSNVTDEMADVYLQVTPVHPGQRAALMEDYRRYDLAAQAAGYRKSLDLYPNDPWRQEGLAACYVGLGEPDKAAEILETRLITGPAAVFPVVSLGMAQLAMGDAARAEERLREALAKDDRYALAWFGLGKALAAQKKPEEAERTFRKTVELTPDFWEARLSLADLLIARGRLDEAEAVCTVDLRDAPDLSNVYLKLAEISAKRRHYDQALAHCETAQRMAPYIHPPKTLLAVFCFANGDHEMALRLLHESRAESPGHPVPALLLGQLAHRQKNNEDARELLNAAAALPTPDTWPRSHHQRFGVLLNSERLRLAQQLGDAALARDALTRWLELDPDNAQVRKLLDATPGPEEK